MLDPSGNSKAVTLLVDLRNSSSSSSMGKVVRVPSIIDNSKKKTALKLSIKNMKRHAKAMKCAAAMPGVMTASVCPKENRLDPVGLIRRLTKNLGYEELLMVNANHEENVEDHKKPESCLPFYDDHPAKVVKNAPHRYRVLNAILSPFLTERTKSKFVVGRPAKVTEALLKYTPVEAIPTQYGGLKPEKDNEFSMEEERVLELTAKAASSGTIEIPALEKAQDRLLLWRLNHTQKDGSLSSEEAKQKWKLACQILAEKGLIPEDENIEENERVYTAVMESEHPNSMLCKDFGMTFIKNFSDNAPNFDGAESSNNNTAKLAKLAEEVSEQSKEIQSLKNTTNQLVTLLQQHCQVSQACLPSTTDDVENDASAVALG